MVKILYGNEIYFSSFYEALTKVAAEKIYLEMIQPPPFEKVSGYQRDLISRNGPVYYAVENDRVVGWCDIFPEENPRHNHRGSLGMGLLKDYRGKGLGRQLLEKVIEHAKNFDLEKIELQVYTTNTAAVELYKKVGFEQEGLIRKYRKLDGQYFDSIMMAKLLPTK